MTESLAVDESNSVERDGRCSSRVERRQPWGGSVAGASPVIAVALVLFANYATAADLPVPKPKATFTERWGMWAKQLIPIWTPAPKHSSSPKSKEKLTRKSEKKTAR